VIAVPPDCQTDAEENHVTVEGQLHARRSLTRSQAERVSVYVDVAGLGSSSGVIRLAVSKIVVSPCNPSDLSPVAEALRERRSASVRVVDNDALIGLISVDPCAQQIELAVEPAGNDTV